ncbi:hypothetical protein TELCIR_18461 [Teladorsagia circumcincta]|uniref:Uncharacterized protein n=1 Tax=Teladorsagia circumcincta TaxID=45464 RepID=A0A2G9TPY1_TELCI|nr:hypothetical protein TELCIR_18461 [Teladorsagia circumcincta]
MMVSVQKTALTGPVNFYSDYVAFLDGVHITPGKDGKFRRCMRHRFLDCPKQKLAYDILTFSATKVALGYTTYAFVTMNLNPAFFVYKRVYFVVHIVAFAIVFVLPRFFPPMPSGGKSSSVKNSHSIIEPSEGKKNI